jgi:hypothetical protein
MPYKSWLEEKNRRKTAGPIGQWGSESAALAPDLLFTQRQLVPDPTGIGHQGLILME